MKCEIKILAYQMWNSCILANIRKKKREIFNFTFDFYPHKCLLKEKKKPFWNMRKNCKHMEITFFGSEIDFDRWIATWIVDLTGAYRNNRHLRRTINVYSQIPKQTFKKNYLYVYENNRTTHLSPNQFIKRVKV